MPLTLGHWHNAANCPCRVPLVLLCVRWQQWEGYLSRGISFFWTRWRGTQASYLSDLDLTANETNQTCPICFLEILLVIYLNPKRCCSVEELVLRFCPQFSRVCSGSGMGNTPLTAQMLCSGLICSLIPVWPALPSGAQLVSCPAARVSLIWQCLRQSCEERQAACPSLRIRHLCHCQHFPWAQLELGIGRQQG